MVSEQLIVDLAPGRCTVLHVSHAPRIVWRLRGSGLVSQSPSLPTKAFSQAIPPETWRYKGATGSAGLASAGATLGFAVGVAGPVGTRCLEERVFPREQEKKKKPTMAYVSSRTFLAT